MDEAGDLLLKRPHVLIAKRQPLAKDTNDKKYKEPHYGEACRNDRKVFVT